MNFRRSILNGAILAAGGISLAPVASAQGLVLEEVVVSAQRRVESLQEVPVSVSAFNESTIRKSDITQASDYLVMTPNVGFSEDGEGGSRSVSISIRGVSNITLDGISTANSIGYYIDELSVGSVAQGTINPQLQDVERIEVLRGPQGTYYGRNAVGGAINITTNKPTDKFYLEASVNAGSFDTYGAEGIVNLPISDRVMARGVFAYEESDAAIDNVNPTGNDPSYEYGTGRLALRILPTDAFTLDLSITRTNEDEGGDISVPTGVVDLDTQSIFGIGAHDAVDSGQGFYPHNDDKIDRDTRELNEKEFTIVNARAVWELDTFSVSSITGWLDSSFDRVSDLDGIPFTFGPLPLRRVNDYGAESYSQEIRLQSLGSDTYKWTAGVFYARDKFKQDNQIQILPDDNPNGEALAFINRNDREFEFENYAVFGEVLFNMTESIDLTVGGRYSWDNVDASDIDQARGPVALKDSVDFTDFSPRVVLRYIPSDDLTVYASASKGYKAGGTDVTGGSRTEGVKYDSEELISYELGVKSRLLGSRMNLSAAVFSLQWDDFQVQTDRLEDPSDISSAISTTQNADSASAEGVELELVALLVEGLTASLNVGYIDAKFDDYDNAVLKGETNGLPNVIDVSGEPLIRTPEWSASAALQYDFTVSNFDAYVRGEWSYVDETVSDIEAVGSLVGETVNGDPFNLPKYPYQIDDYNVVNLYAGFENRRFRVAAFVKNALDEDYYTGTSDNFGAAGIRVRPHYREFGVKLTYMMQ
ncbi:MAG: TonB-dependent receptor [Halioglobus sp.]|nr:TonB-dependent receptor [Halioglobus sp.]